MKIMKRFIALFLSLTMLSTSVAFAGESVKGHFSAFDDVPSEVAPQGELDAVSGEIAPLLIYGAGVVLGTLGIGIPGMATNLIQCGSLSVCSAKAPKTVTPKTGSGSTKTGAGSTMPVKTGVKLPTKK